MNNTYPFNNKNLDTRVLYEKLENYYENNSLYDEIQAFNQSQGETLETIKGLITPVFRSVEFFTSKIIPGDLGNINISTKNTPVKEAIQQVWKWSNFAAKKQVAVRKLALLGNLFWKALTDGEKVWFESIEPKYVSSFELDSRGYILKIRIDVPTVIEEENYTHTEYWSKKEGYYAIWIHKMGATADLDTLGDPNEYESLLALGIDFVPFVHCKFIDIGKDLGASCVFHALDKVDDANRLRTKLEQMAFNYGEPNMVLKSTSAVNKPGPGFDADEPVKVGGGKFYKLGPNQDLDWPIQNLPYGDLLEISRATLEQLEQDLPELRYYNIKDGQLSGQAIRQILGAAISRGEEARGNFIQALIRISEICLTLGKVWNLFPNIGSYENEDFSHSIQCPDMFPMTLAEKAANVKLFIDAGMALPTAMRFCNYSEEEIAIATQEKQADEQRQSDMASQNLANSMMAFNGG